MRRSAKWIIVIVLFGLIALLWTLLVTRTRWLPDIADQLPRCVAMACGRHQ